MTMSIRTIASQVSILCLEAHRIMRTQKKDISFRDFLRFATTYATARKETPNLARSTVCRCMIYRRSQFQEITKHNSSPRDWLCQKRNANYLMILKTPWLNDAAQPNAARITYKIMLKFRFANQCRKIPSLRSRICDCGT